MKKRTLAILAAASLMLLTSACKRSQTNAPAAAAEEQAAAAEEQAAASAEGQAATDGKSPASDGSLDAIPVPENWAKLSAQTPKGVTVSFGVPSGWVEIPPPNESTLLVRGAPYKIEAGGTKATLVAVEFEGGRTALADYTRQRLAGFATVRSEGEIQVGKLHGYEFVAVWSGPTGDRNTVQLLLATGDEAIAVTCELLPNQLETLRGLCNEIFATVTIEGATLK